MNQDFKNFKKRLVSCSLLLSLMLTGCSKDKNVYVGNNSTAITYAGENQELISGTISSEKADVYIKIVTFKRDDVTFTRLVAIEDHMVYAGRGVSNHRITKYVDIDTGTDLISYKNKDSSGKSIEHIKYYVGEDLEIVSQIDLMPYLYQEEKFQDEYEINDLISFYHDKVEPTLSEDEGMTLN